MIYSDCKKKHRVIASFTTNLNDPNRATWDLTPYQSAGLGTPGGTWRLVEAGAGVVYASGKIAPDGTLVSNDYVAPSASGLRGGGNNRAGGENNNSGNEDPETLTPSGVPDDFTTSYSYDGYMELEEEEPEKQCPYPEQQGTEECCPE